MQGENVFRRVLVPVDGSVQSVLAQELAAFVAKRFKSEVTVIHVIAQYPQLHKTTPEYEVVLNHGLESLKPQLAKLPTQTAPLLIKNPTSSRDAIHSEINAQSGQEGQSYVADAARLFKEEGVPVDRKLVGHVDPAEAIIQEAQEGNYGLIVMAHNAQEEQESRLGSVVEKVSRHAQAPVLIAKGKQQISNILVPLDGSENAENALPYAALLAERTNAKMTLLHVQEPSLLKLKPEVAKEIGTRILARATEQVKKAKPSQILASGHPAKTIVETTKKGDYDLIAMGKKGHSAIERFLLGSVSDHVVHYADRSVLLVK